MQEKAQMRSATLAVQARRAIATLYPLAILAIIWQALSVSGWVSPRLMPPLGEIGHALIDEIIKGDLIFHAAVSLSRAGTGFALAIVIGVLLGIAMARIRWFEWLFEPLFAFGYPVPKIAFYPVFILVFGFGSWSKIILITLECLFPITVNTYFGTRAVPQRYEWAAKNMGANGIRRLFRVILPSALPTIMSGIRIALPVALIIVIVTEMIGESVGLGYFINYASASFLYADAYAGVIAIAF